MRAIKLVIEPFNFISLLKVEIIKMCNDHGGLHISGIVSEKDGDIYQKEFYKEQPVCLKAITEEDKEIILFQGIVISRSLQTEGRAHKLSFKAKTGSYLLDRKPHTRFFQDASMSYEAVMRGIIKGAGGDVLMVDKYQQEISDLIVQYKETDWAFCKRLSNNLGLPLLPEFQQLGKLFHIGLQNKSGGSLESKEYSIEARMPESLCDSFIWSERGIFVVDSREIYQLGEHVTFNQKRLTVARIESHLEGEELWNRYYFCLLKTEPDSLYYNKRIQGVSMKGKVDAVKETTVQVSIYEDENKSKGGHWFEFATVYSTPDGTGWYCMPEIGDEIRLAFPTEDETMSYTASSVHLDGKSGRDNPDHKFLRNKWGKEIRFTPNSLSLSNSAGLSVILDDNSGISISSNKGIQIKGTQQISMNSQSNIKISGSGKVSINQGSASIQMDDAINISGGKINMN